MERVAVPTDPFSDDDLLDDAAGEALPVAAKAKPTLGERLGARVRGAAAAAGPRAWVAGGLGVLMLAMGAGWAAGRSGAPAPTVSAPAVAQTAPVQAPAASPADVLPLPVADNPKRERNRFTRADRDDDGLIQQSEYLATRRRNYDKLDANRDGALDFAEYAASGIGKFAGADADRSGTLNAREFATLAPKPRLKRAAPCAPAGSAGDAE